MRKDNIHNIPPIVLIVEDELDQQEILVELLEADYTLLVAKNGQEAIEFFRDYSTDIAVILLDIGLPDFDAFELYKKMEALCFTIMPNIITVTAYSKTTDVIKTMTELRAFDHIEKPFEEELLLKTINIACHESFPRKDYEAQQDIFLDQLLTDRNIYMLTKLHEWKNSLDKKVSSVELNQQMMIHSSYTDGISKKNYPLKTILHTFEEDTGKKAILPWKPKMLIIEDEDDLRDFLVELFESVDFDTLSVDDAPDALEIINTEKDIDIILLDIGLPSVDGIEIVKHIKQESPRDWKPENQTPDIIALSSKDEKDIIKDSIKAGIITYLEKPIPSEAIIKSVQDVFFKRYCLRALPVLLDALKKQTIPFRFRSDPYIITPK